MPLIDYIAANFGGNNSEFARHMGVTRQKVNDWLNNKYIVVDNMLYSPRREVPPVTL